MKQNRMIHSGLEFSLTRTPKIVFGWGLCEKLGELASSYGRKILLVTGDTSYRSTLIAGKIEESLKNYDFTWHRFIVTKEPSPLMIDNAIKEFKKNNIDAVIAVGGGSVMDTGKAVSAMLLEEGDVIEFLDDVGTRKPSGKRLPLLVLPTTAGTGSEATPNAVITESGKTGFKKSLRHDNYIPDLAIISPELTVDCPPEITAASGMDAFTQLLESYLSTDASPITDALAVSSLKRISRSLMDSFVNGRNKKSREDMSYAALLSGITLANAGLGAIHGFAQPLGSLFSIPHGLVCGTLMGVVNRVTVERLKAGSDNSDGLKKYAVLGRLFSANKYSDDDSNIHYLLDTIDEYVETFQMPRLGAFGVTQDDLQRIINLTGLKNHPVNLDASDLLRILKKRL